MEIRHLRYFVAVVEEGTFTRAAQRLFIAQPALSKQIQDLEDEIGTRLLVRTARGASPTAPGVELLKHARAILEGEAAAKARMRAFATAAPSAEHSAGTPIRPLHPAARERAAARGGVRAVA